MTLSKRFRSWLKATVQRRVVERGEPHQQARLEFGSVRQTKEACREARGKGLLDSLLLDLRYGLRLLRRTPGFAVLAAVTLALAVVGTAIIGFALRATFGLRPTTEVERQGLDVTEHGEEGYIL